MGRTNEEMEKSDLLGELNSKLSEALATGDEAEADRVRARIAVLDGELDFDDEFVKNWYNEGW